MNDKIRFFEDFDVGPSGHDYTLGDIIAALANCPGVMGAVIDEFYYDPGYDSEDCARVSISGVRDKTPEELAAEQEKARIKEEKKRQKELAQLAKLKAKYEAESVTIDTQV